VPGQRPSAERPRVIDELLGAVLIRVAAACPQPGSRKLTPTVSHARLHPVGHLHDVRPRPASTRRAIRRRRARRRARGTARCSRPAAVQGATTRRAGISRRRRLPPSIRSQSSRRRARRYRTNAWTAARGARGRENVAARVPRSPPAHRGVDGDGQGGPSAAKIQTGREAQRERARDQHGPGAARSTPVPRVARSIPERRDRRGVDAIRAKPIRRSPSMCSG